MRIKVGIAMAEWISVKDRVPEWSVNVIGTWDGKVRVLTFVEFLNEFQLNGQKIAVTHWMPIPKLPGK